MAESPVGGLIGRSVEVKCTTKADTCTNERGRAQRHARRTWGLHRFSPDWSSSVTRSIRLTSVIAVKFRSYAPPASREVASRSSGCRSPSMHDIEAFFLRNMQDTTSERKGDGSTTGCEEEDRLGCIKWQARMTAPLYYICRYTMLLLWAWIYVISKHVWCASILTQGSR